MFTKTLKAVPWAGVKLLLLLSRRMRGTVPWPEHQPEVVTEASPDEIDAALQRQPQARYEDGTLTSWRYENEILNLRTPWGTTDDGYQRQFHARFRVRDDGLTGGVAHFERSWYEPGHIHDVEFRWSAAALRNQLSLADIQADIEE